MSPRIVVVKAARLPEVLAIEQRGYLFPWSERVLRDTFKSGTHCWGVEDEAGRLWAYAFVTLVAGEAQVLNVCVDPAAQGQGLGRMLMQHVMQVARDELCTIVLLEVRRSNHVARRLYERLGFATLGVRKGYYPAADSQREDALVLGHEIT